jgi:hypothetical protein
MRSNHVEIPGGVIKFGGVEVLLDGLRFVGQVFVSLGTGNRS